VASTLDVICFSFSFRSNYFVGWKM